MECLSSIDLVGIIAQWSTSVAGAVVAEPRHRIVREEPAVTTPTPRMSSPAALGAGTPFYFLILRGRMASPPRRYPRQGAA
jgi:hypothetical protein